MQKPSLIYQFSPEDVGRYKRLDTFLAEKCEDLSRTQIKKLMTDGQITLLDSTQSQENPVQSLSKMPASGMTIKVTLPQVKDVGLVRENIPLDILYEDEHLLIINKSAGLVVHPAPGHSTGTLVNALLYHYPGIYNIGQEERPGIVHRLDKGTTGAMIVAKNTKCHQLLIELFSEHKIFKRYKAITYGTQVPFKGKVESLIGRHPVHRKKMSTKTSNGKIAQTKYQVEKNFPWFQLVDIELLTGRTHQIRVHFTEKLNAPLLGDSLYGRPHNQIKNLPNELSQLIKSYDHPLLHSVQMRFIHPILKKEIDIVAPYSSFFQQFLDKANILHEQ